MPGRKRRAPPEPVPGEQPVKAPLVSKSAAVAGLDLSALSASSGGAAASSSSGGTAAGAGAGVAALPDSARSSGGMSNASNGSCSSAESTDDVSRKWSAFAAGLRVPPPESAAGLALLRTVAASQPVMDMEPFLREVAALRSQLDAVRTSVAEGGGAGERSAAMERLRREGAAKDALIAALKAQVRGLQERLAVEGPIPAGCVASSGTYKAVAAEREGLKAQLAATQAAAEAAAAAAQAAADRAASAAAAQLASAKAQGAFRCLISMQLPAHTLSSC